MAIVAKLELHAVRNAQRFRSRLRDFQLFFRERHTGHFDIGSVREIQRHSAPTAPNVQYLLPRLQAQLRGDMALLRRLRLVQTLFTSLKVSAGILHVSTQKLLIERVAKVVVDLHILPRARDRIMLRKPLGSPRHAAPENLTRTQIEGPLVSEEHPQQIPSTGATLWIFHHQIARHKRFGCPQFGVRENLPVEGRVVHADRYIRPRLVSAERLREPIWPIQSQRSFTDRFAEEFW